MKIYYYTGLKQIAQRSGYRGETLTSLEKCSNFKRTHNFLLQVWQSMYREMLRAFWNYSNQEGTIMPDLHNVSLTTTTDPMVVLCVPEMIHEGSEAVEYKKFREFVSFMTGKDDLWKLWESFTFKDCLAYICNAALRNKMLKVVFKGRCTENDGTPLHSL